MTRPRAGLQACHEGTPYEFLHRVGESKPDDDAPLELWRVRPLFVEAPDKNLLYRSGDRLTPIHGAQHSQVARNEPAAD